MNEDNREFTVPLTGTELGLVMFAVRQIAKKKEKEARHPGRAPEHQESAETYARHLRNALRKMKRVKGLPDDPPDENIPTK